MGTSLSTQTQQPVAVGQQRFQPLSSLLDGLPDHNAIQPDPNGNNLVNWDNVRESLREAPEQACLYAHHLEPSPLFIAVSRSCPVDVAMMLIDAYDDALDHDFHGQTVLHAACTGESGGDAAVIKLLLSKKPQFAKCVASDGMLPLHCCRSVGGAQELIRSYPEAVATRSRGRGSVPLHHVLLDAIEELQHPRNELQLDTELCRVLIEASSHSSSASGLLCRNKKGQTPLSLMVRILDQCMQTELESRVTASSIADDLWELFVSRCVPPLMKHNKTDKELHTMIELVCCHTKALMDRALQDFEEQASQRDSMGRTPLHIAAHIGSCCSSEALASLIRANPKAPRMTDNEGRLPIDWAAESPHIALQNLSLLAKGEPRAIDTRDLRDRHYPFVSAAISEHASVNNTYYLLRAKPHVISYFHLP